MAVHETSQTPWCCEPTPSNEFTINLKYRHSPSHTFAFLENPNTISYHVYSPHRLSLTLGGCSLPPSYRLLSSEHVELNFLSGESFPSSLKSQILHPPDRLPAVCPGRWSLLRHLSLGLWVAGEQFIFEPFLHRHIPLCWIQISAPLVVKCISIYPRLHSLFFSFFFFYSLECDSQTLLFQI